jgi:hypothetical protein
MIFFKKIKKIIPKKRRMATIIQDEPEELFPLHQEQL